MKPFRYFLGFLACMGWLAGQAVADELHPKQITLPEDVKSLAPTGMSPIFYSSADPDAVMVLESKDGSSVGHYSSPKTRLLILLQKKQGKYKELERSDKIIACSTCSKDLIDPFVPEGIKLKKGNLVIEQDYSVEPSMAVYKFAYNSKLSRWMVISAVNTDVEQNPFTSAFIKMPHKLQLPTPPLLTNFNPEWRTPQFWNAVIINDKTHDFSLPAGKPNKQSLDKDIQEECQTRGVCHVLVQQQYGCVALIQDSQKNSFAGTSFDHNNGRHEAEATAMQECSKAGGSECKVAAFTYCSPSYK